MRFRKGSKVEVLSKKEVPSGSWRSAEIMSGSGHYYTVRYDKFEGGSNQTVVERVSRKAIRPCPPSLEVLENWIPGDVVEVFNDRSWKMATVSEVLGKNNYLVRLLGSSSEFKVCKFDIRARRSWQDDKWVLMHKRSGNRGDDSKEDANASPRFYGLSSQIQKFQNVPNLDTWRRGSNYECSQAETMGRAGLKCRTLKKKQRYHKVVARNPSTLHEHVKSLVIQRGMLGGNIGGALDRTIISEMNCDRKKQMGVAYHSFAENFELNDADRATCSVGSCSVSNSDHHGLRCRVSIGHNEDTDGSTSDAESFCHLGYRTDNFLLSRDEPLEAEIHRLELHAYRCTMEALYASGPLSWEKELLLTDLRLSLHISNDEHLMEIKNLVSTSISSR
ncbi:uncharacterized protein LOC111444134 isoform X1 [Cucurbita moschata]|uniref:Uncharacterized protein LOC111444134 isoform X1 n=1 Tax=Cucurbita moschata TaxID=3662 RepID=A0A6J1FBL1_CUCMO|nr:uncharacterized protein LOC111444134 isoform X1 [Cucurbita moschata]XP_022937877.1 uncharacterized protein LOC111444134 isoform X1 [Cucurbita moschata]